MSRNWLRIIIVAGLVLSFVLALASPLFAKETVWWKDTSTQVIPSNKWTYLSFNGKSTISKDAKGRALYCAQTHLAFNAKKPRYVKLRFTRKLENGKIDTTGTTTWVLGKNAPLTWQGSTCWPINTLSGVAVQIKIGGTGKWNSPLRQFKVWAPKGGLPDETILEANPS